MTRATVTLMVFAAFLAACSTQTANGGASGQVGGGTSVGQGPIGSTSSSSMLMQNIKQSDSSGR